VIARGRTPLTPLLLFVRLGERGVVTSTTVGAGPMLLVLWASELLVFTISWFQDDLGKILSSAGFGFASVKLASLLQALQLVVSLP
jgi:hypothetical protein